MPALAMVHHVGAAAGNSCRLIRLLQRVRYVEDYGASVFLHFGNPTVIDDKVLVTERCAAFGDCNLLVAGIAHLLHGVAHGVGRQELSFLDVDHLAGSGSGHQQVGLTAKECRDLQDVDIFRSHFSFLSGVYVGHYRDVECVAHLLQYPESLNVSYAGK